MVIKETNVVGSNGISCQVSEDLSKVVGIEEREVKGAKTLTEEIKANKEKDRSNVWPESTINKKKL